MQELTQSEIEQLDQLRQQDLFSRLEAIERAVLILSRPRAIEATIVPRKAIYVDPEPITISLLDSMNDSIKAAERVVADDRIDEILRLVRSIDFSVKGIGKEDTLSSSQKLRSRVADLDFDDIEARCPECVSVKELVQFGLFTCRSKANGYLSRGKGPKMVKEGNSPNARRVCSRQHFISWLRSQRF